MERREIYPLPKTYPLSTQALHLSRLLTFFLLRFPTKTTPAWRTRKARTLPQDPRRLGCEQEFRTLSPTPPPGRCLPRRLSAFFATSIVVLGVWIFSAEVRIFGIFLYCYLRLRRGEDLSVLRNAGAHEVVSTSGGERVPEVNPSDQGFSRIFWIFLEGADLWILFGMSRTLLPREGLSYRNEKEHYSQPNPSQRAW